MLHTLTLILLVIALAIAIVQFANLLTFDWYINRKTSDEFLSFLQRGEYERNPFSPNDLLCSERSHAIARVPVAMFSKYYIFYTGQIPRWHPLSKELDRFFAEHK